MQENIENIERILLSDYERKKKLADYVRFSCAKGWVVESQNDFNAVLYSGQPCNHTIHALVTFVGGLVTCGFLLLWGFVWIILALSQYRMRMILNIDEYGEIVTQTIRV